MDIKNLSESLAAKPIFPQERDLLAQLKAAGSVEAEVIKVLQDKLLLSTRLGDFLTSNTLNYKRGDQIELRLGGSEQKPVLKSRPLTPTPVILDSARNPRLRRALVPDQTMLAVVTRVAPQRMEIRLAEQILTLPRQSGVSRNQLLSLQRIDGNRSIEITPLERKQIYKALLKQLIPRQTESSSSNLVKTLELVNKAIAEPRAQPQSTLNLPRQAAKPDNGNNQLPVPATRTTPVTPTIPATPSIAKTTGVEQQLTATKSDLRPTIPKRSPPTLASVDATRQPVETVSTGSNQQISSLLQQIKRVARNSSGLTATSKAPTPPPQATEVRNPQPTAVTPKASPPTTREPVANAISEPAASNKSAPATLPVGGTSIGTAPIDARAAVPLVQASDTLATTAESARSGENQNGETKAPTTLQRLLQLVPRLNQLSPAQIKQWLEFASLVRPTPAQSAQAQSNPLQLLKQVASQDNLSREIIQSIQPKANPGASNEPTPAKTLPQELLQQYVRDGIKLIEQAVSQNLLQRASLGMQQETQQPLSLNFAIPFLEEQQVKPLQIELAQREQAREDGERGWDLRVNFEFADLGPVAVHIFLEGFTVAASFYAEHSLTRNRIEHALPELRQQLTNAGFTTGELHSFSGVSGDKPAGNSGLSESLIDIEV